jgi:hypothetical protein
MNDKTETWDGVGSGTTLRYVGDEDEYWADDDLTFEKCHALTATVMFRNQEGDVVTMDSRWFGLGDFEHVGDGQ